MFGTLRILFPSCIHNISWPVSQSCQGLHLVQPINEINYSDKKNHQEFQDKIREGFFSPHGDTMHVHLESQNKVNVFPVITRKLYTSGLKYIWPLIGY